MSKFTPTNINIDTYKNQEKEENFLRLRFIDCLNIVAKYTENEANIVIILNLDEIPIYDIENIEITYKIRK
jgi:hypothetical protein